MHRYALEAMSWPGRGIAVELASVDDESEGEVKAGSLRAIGDSARAPIANFIPRFVQANGYTASFGNQWNRYRRVQLDAFNGTTLSRDRLLATTCWSLDELRGQKILEVGCGAGRFTQILLDAGAEVYTVDYSTAVDACWANNGPHPNLTVAQADLYALPFRVGSFDKVLCLGVLQHTPDVKLAFMSLLPFVKPGGWLAIDLYPRLPWIYRWTAKYWYRPVTVRLPVNVLRRIVEWYVPRWIPIDNFFQRVPLLRWIVPALIPCWNMTGALALSPEQAIEWSVLDTFDALASRYDQPQTADDVRAWFAEAGWKDAQVRLGGNGVIGVGARPD